MDYRVLIGAPNRDLGNSLLTRFGELPGWEVVGTHRSHQELAAAIPRLPGLELVMLHEDLGPIPVLEQVRDIAGRYPQLAILVMVREVTQELIARAAEAGARGVVSDDSPLEEMEARVNSAGEWARTLQNLLESRQLDVPLADRRGSILTFTGSKGGVGTTTVAVHTAIRAARSGHTTCLADLDLTTGDVTGLFDLNHRRSITDLLDAGSEITASMLTETLYVHPTGPHILLAPEHGERGEDVTAEGVRHVLGALRARYDLVIVDCGSVMNEATAMAAELADTAVVVTAPDLAGLRGGQRLLEMWERLQVRKKPDVLSLLVRQHKKNEIQPDFARKLLNTPFLETAIPANYRALEAASNTGDPDRMTDPELSKAFTRLAEELNLLASPKKPAPAEGEGDHTGPSAAEAFVNASGGRAPKGDRGAQMLEFAFLLPFLGLALLLVWQVVLFGLTSMYTSHAANEAARQAAVTPDDMELIHEEATKRIAGPWSGSAFSLSIQHSGGMDYAQVGIDMPWVLPLPGTDDIRLTARSPIIAE